MWKIYLKYKYNEIGMHFYGKKIAEYIQNKNVALN